MPPKASPSPSKHPVKTESNRIETPQVTRRDPSVLTPTTSALKNRSQPLAPIPVTSDDEPPRESKCKKCKKYMYNRENKTVCERTCQSWFYIIGYSVLYFIFLTTFTMIVLYCSLEIIKYMQDVDENYFDDDIGLTATPVTRNIFPLISYRNGDADDYEKYVTDLDNLLTENHRSKRELNSKLGPCGIHPYGYGEMPCIVIKINKQVKWTAKPLLSDSPYAKEAPEEVQKWVKTDQTKLWLQCNGYHSYDKEHIGNIRYYPDPPGFNSDLFPNMKSPSPLVAIQVSNFTIGISLAIECKLWYEGGVSTLQFMLYVVPKLTSLRNNTVVSMENKVLGR